MSKLKLIRTVAYGCIPNSIIPFLQGYTLVSDITVLFYFLFQPACYFQNRWITWPLFLSQQFLFVCTSNKNASHNYAHHFFKRKTHARYCFQIKMYAVFPNNRHAITFINHDYIILYYSILFYTHHSINLIRMFWQNEKMFLWNTTPKQNKNPPSRIRKNATRQQSIIIMLKNCLYISCYK